MLLAFRQSEYFLSRPAIQCLIHTDVPAIQAVVDNPPLDPRSSPPIHTSASNPFSRNRSRYRLRNDVPPRYLPLNINYTLPPVGQSIYNTHVTRSDLYVPPRGQGYLFPQALFTPCDIDFTAPGWLSDYRLRPIVNRLQSGNVYVFLKGYKLRSYFILMQGLPNRDNSRKYLTLSDTSQFATFISLSGVSDPRRSSLYKKFQKFIKDREIIRLSENSNLFFFLKEMPETQHLIALDISVSPVN